MPTDTARPAVDLPPGSSGSAPPTAPPTAAQTATAVLASLFGWGLDLFDLFILLYVAPVVGALFFPAGTPMLSLAGAYASFAVTLLIRPLGSALFGSYADRNGRRRTMMIAVTGVGVSTAAFGLLPTVPQIGLTATVMFLVLRLVQGVFVGGVVAASHTIGTETVPERWRGLMSGGVGGGGSAIGGMLASLIFFVVSLVAPGPAFAEWGWRLMFFSGLLTTAVGLALFRNLEESPLFRQLAARKARRAAADAAMSPLRQLFLPEHRRAFAIALLLAFGSGGAYYLTSGYLPSFLKLVNGVPNATASLILVVGNLGAAVGAPGVGMLSQRIGRRPAFLLMGIVRLAAFPALFLAMAHTRSPALLAGYVAILAFVANGSYGPLLIHLNELFPTEIRASGTGLSWNIGFALGGMLPTLVSVVAGSPAELPIVLVAFTAVVTIVYLLGAVLTRETLGGLERA